MPSLPSPDELRREQAEREASRMRARLEQEKESPLTEAVETLVMEFLDRVDALAITTRTFTSPPNIPARRNEEYIHEIVGFTILHLAGGTSVPHDRTYRNKTTGKLVRVAPGYEPRMTQVVVSRPPHPIALRCDWREERRRVGLRRKPDVTDTGWRHTERQESLDAPTLFLFSVGDWPRIERTNFGWVARTVRSEGDAATHITEHLKILLG